MKWSSGIISVFGQPKTKNGQLPGDFVLFGGVVGIRRVDWLSDPRARHLIFESLAGLLLLWILFLLTVFRWFKILCCCRIEEVVVRAHSSAVRFCLTPRCLLIWRWTSTSHHRLRYPRLLTALHFLPRYPVFALGTHSSWISTLFLTSLLANRTSSQPFHGNSHHSKIFTSSSTKRFHSFKEPTQLAPGTWWWNSISKHCFGSHCSLQLYQLRAHLKHGKSQVSLKRTAHSPFTISLSQM